MATKFPFLMKPLLRRHFLLTSSRHLKSFFNKVSLITSFTVKFGFNNFTSVGVQTSQPCSDPFTTKWYTQLLCHNGRHSAEAGDNSMKTRSERPWGVTFVYYSMASSPSGLLSNSSSAILLVEDNIPGAYILGWKPEELKMVKLWLWLKCFGDL